MKSILSLLLIIWCINANALPSAVRIDRVAERRIESTVSVPGYAADTINLAVAIEYSNSCVAQNNTVAYSIESGLLGPSHTIDLHNIWTSGIACPAVYAPVIKWSVLELNLEAGQSVQINNGGTITLRNPEPAICVLSMCEDGKPRDSYTCACSDGSPN